MCGTTLLLFSSLGLFAAEPRVADEREVLLVSAAASLKGALQDLSTQFALENPGARIVLNCAASGLLLRQIEQGAPVDLFLSASTREMDRLQKAGGLLGKSRTTFASNRLVAVYGPGAPTPSSFEDLRNRRFARIAIGNPKTVPAGRYAAETLHALGLWRDLEERLVFGEDVRQVLEYVARGDADAGLVYRTDLELLGGKVRLGPEAPEHTHAPILYQAAVPAGAPHPEGGRRLRSFLLSEAGQRILARHGFLPAPDSTP